MNFNELFCDCLSIADRYQKLLEDEDKCKILKQNREFFRTASLVQKSELETARQVLMINYGFHEMSRSALQKSYNELIAELEVTRSKYEEHFKELVAAIHNEFGDLPVEEVWPKQFIDSNNTPEPIKYYVDLIGFGKEEMIARRAFYRSELRSSRAPITPYDLESAYMTSKVMFGILYP